MKKPGILLTLLAAALLLFSACAAPSPSSGPSPSRASRLFTLDDAKEEFLARYPDVTIEVARQEGNAHTIEGWAGNMLHKMKFAVMGGEVLLDEMIETEKP